LVHVPKQARPTPAASQREETTDNLPENTEISDGETAVYLSQQIAYRISQSDSALRDLFEAIRQFLLGLGDDVQMKELKYYVAFKRLKNFACLEVYPQARVVTMHLKVDPDSVKLEEGFSRDVREIGHFGTGDLQLSLRTMDDFAKAQPLIRRSYEGS
jgi:predicted transport protein